MLSVCLSVRIFVLSVQSAVIYRKGLYHANHSSLTF